MHRVPRYSYSLIIAGISTLAVLPACSSRDDGTDEMTTVAAEQVANTPTVTPLNADVLANMTYSGITDAAITLEDGHWDGQSYMEGGAERPAVGLVEDFLLAGDLDGDGTDEVVVLLWESSGGSGTRSYVASVGRRDGDTVNTGTALVGDRVQVRSGRIADGRIEMDVIQQGPADSACCPSQLARRSWTLDANSLIEREAENTGVLSLDVLAGKEWVLAQLEHDKPVPVQPEVTLVFDAERVTGKSACNRYFAGVTAGDMPGELAVSQAGGTRMACPGEIMDLERSYLEALGNVSRFSFLAGKLVLAWQKDDVTNTMLFVSREQQGSP
jgi:heat shock protein HslJ